MEKEVAITYETLFEFLRLEKGREQLQKLPESFFEDVTEYLREKQKVLDEASNKSDLFSSTEKDKIRNQIDNTRRILKDLYERREKKIINLAVIKSKTQSTAMDTSMMLPVEKQLYKDIVGELDRYRKGIIFQLFQLKMPEVEQRQGVDQTDNTPKEPDMLTVRFLKPVPQFVGKELEPYGPYKEDDIAKVPTSIAKLLMEKGRAEQME